MFLLADETSTIFEALTNESKSYNYWSEFVNMMVALVAILALAFFTVWFLKRLAKSRYSQRRARTSSFRILERKPLGPKSALYLIDILGQGVVIAESSTGGIQLIKEFAADINVETLMEELLDGPEDLPSFKERVMQKLTLKTVKRA